jgi:TolB-like protein/DNA-binding SARP family transcriptional activator
LVSTREGDLVLNDTLLSADVRRFRSAVDRADGGSLAEAIELYRGSFLEGERSLSPEFEDWLGLRRAEFAEQVLGALLRLADMDAAAELHGNALAHARQALAMDPLSEQAHRHVMRALAAVGQRSGALRQYDAARQLLVEELGVPPEPETEALRAAIARCDQPSGSKPAAPAVSASTRGAAPRRPVLAARRWREITAAVALVPLLAVGAGIVSHRSSRPPPASTLPAIAVLPFENVSGDAAQDYLGYGVVEEIITSLSTYPSIRVVSRRRSFGYERARNTERVPGELGADYVLEGSARRTDGMIHITAQLTDAATGDHLWAGRFQRRGDDIRALQDEIANEIHETLVGFRGEIGKQEQRTAWSKVSTNLEEQDYALRGQQFYFRFTRDSHARAREIWQEGLTEFPHSTRLRIGLAVIYRHAVEAGWSPRPEQDLESAWKLVTEAALEAQKSRFDEWVTHLALAKLAQWCRQDFDRSLAEAELAIQMVPYDASSRADLAELLANAGKLQDSIAWLKEAIRRDPQPPDWYAGNLAWAYYLDGRYQDAVAQLEGLNRPRRLVLAAAHVRLGQSEKAKAAMAEFVKENPGYTLADEARRPLVSSLEQRWLADLRRAGLPEEVQ